MQRGPPSSASGRQVYKDIAEHASYGGTHGPESARLVREEGRGNGAQLEGVGRRGGQASPKIGNKLIELM